MSADWVIFLFSTFFAIAVQGVFTLFEMACVSFNKVRLQYYVSRGQKRAIWLNYLLKRPSRLFGTTLIGINTALQVGSECSRRFYESIHIDPDWAPVTQILIVVVFAELAPLFAARRHPEQAAMGLIPFMMVLARILAPIIWAFDALSHLIHRLMGKPIDAPLFLSRDEVKMAFEEQEEREDEFSQLASRVFQLKSKAAGELMIPLSRIHMVASNASLADVRHMLSIHYAPFILVYHRYPHNVVAIAHLRDLLRMEENRRVLDHARSPWFVAQGTSILEILNQFRRNNQSVAVILDPSGQSCGILTLDDVVEQIFGEEEWKSVPEKPSVLYVERTLSGEMDVSAFNREFDANLFYLPGDTLSDLIFRSLDHLPAKDETVRIGSYLFTVIEPSMRGAKILSVRTFQE